MTRKLPQLTYRKLTILLHLEAGLGYKEIADALGIHPDTVRGHVIEIAMKLPGNGPPMDRVLLWCDRLLCAHPDVVGHLRR
jgi:FixJ family two-component response regulator